MLRTTKTMFGAGVVALAGGSVVSAAIIPLYTEAEQADLGLVWNANLDAGDGTTYGVDVVNAGTSPASPFGTGNAMRMYDFNSGDKPEVQLDLATPITGAFRVDFKSFNNSVNSSSKAIRFRMANAGLNISSESRTAFSLSWQADGEVTAKSDAGFGVIATKSSDPLVGVQAITLVGNAAVSDNYSYMLFGQSRTLNAQSYDVFINGVLLNDSSDADEINGLLFTLSASAANYDPTLGLSRIGLIGSSNGDVDPDYFFDDIILRTGNDVIPEPASVLLLGLGALALRRR
jgi:hypothetical protein